MSEKPLLMFPTPTIAGRKKLTSGGGKVVTKPSKESQIARIEPKFDLLEQTLRSRRISLQSSPNGIEPEMALVIETRGTVEEFFKAVSRIPELEWLGELEDEFEADELFYINASNENIKGRLFFIMTNYQALSQIKSLWDNYYKRNIRFSIGTTKWRDLFDIIYDIREWSLQDRVLETGILEDWRDRVRNNQEIISFEIELWYRDNNNRRRQNRAEIQRLIEQVDGIIVNESIIDEIAYHGLLVTAPIGIFNNLTENDAIDLLKANDIMYIRPTGQSCKELFNDELGSVESEETNIEPLQSNLNANPIVALLDGLPLQNHHLLNNRIIVDDPDNFEENYLSRNRQHGTGMASAIIHGDLNETTQPLLSPLYIRPIMKAVSSFAGEFERVPENELMVDLIHKAVKRIFETQELSSIKIINLSIGDPLRVFNNSLSSCARLLDWLSEKYNVLFIVSAGNFLDGIDIGLNAHQIAGLSQDEVSAQIVKHLFDTVRHRRIISPAESINALTVGGAHEDLSTTFNSLNRINLLENNSLFSTISRFGYGYRRSIKPDVTMPAGRIMYNEPISSTLLKRNGNIMYPPGIKVASPISNTLTGTIYDKGTSYSTALLSRAGIKVYEAFVEDDLFRQIPIEYFPVLVKSLLVHGASWETDTKDTFSAIFNNHDGNIKDLITRFIGYGKVQSDRILNCSKNRVTLLGFGDLSKDNAHLYELPLPMSISGNVIWKKLIVTLAWFAPINPKSRLYRKSKLWFDAPDNSLKNLLKVSRVFYDDDTVNRGTVQHEIFEGTNASAFLENTDLTLRINCKEDSKDFTEFSRYGLAVTLEVENRIEEDIYNEIKLKVQQRIPIS